MELTGALSNPLDSLARLARLGKKLRARSVPNADSRCNETFGMWGQTGKPLPSRPGAVLAAVTLLLGRASRLMSVAEIHAGVASATGAAVPSSSVKGALSSHCRGAEARFRRVRFGVYVLQQ